MEENTQKFDERLKELVALGKKKKSILELQEINDFFNDMELDAEQMEKVFDHLESNNIDVLRISGDDDDVDVEVIITDEEEVDMENIDPVSYTHLTPAESCPPYTGQVGRL